MLCGCYVDKVVSSRYQLERALGGVQAQAGEVGAIRSLRKLGLLGARSG